jgi:hypothetical protein
MSDLPHQAWGLFMSAPVTFLLIMGSVAGAAFWAGWWLRGNFDDGELRGMRGEVGAMRERLNLATDRHTAVAEKASTLENQLTLLQTQLDSHAALSELATSTARVKSTIVAFSRANNDLGKTLSPSLARVSDPPKFIKTSSGE